MAIVPEIEIAIYCLRTCDVLWEILPASKKILVYVYEKVLYGMLDEVRFRGEKRWLLVNAFAQCWW